MKLAEFLPTESNLEILDIMYDSRERRAQSLFYCLSGLTHDGHQFAMQAVNNGAIAVVANKPLTDLPEHVVLVLVEDVEKVFYDSVAKFFNYPSRKLFVAGITGTNGKTSTAIMAHRMASKVTKSAYIGTLGVLFGEETYSYEYTTPDYVSINRYLHEMVKQGVKFCVLEASSQGLELNRLHGIDFNAAVFTNLTHEHLDFHGSMENYYLAKKKLFENLDAEDEAIINSDDAYGQRLVEELEIAPVTYSRINPEADYFLKQSETSVENSTFVLVHDDKEFNFQTDVRGEYNIDNLVDALIVVERFGMDLDKLSQTPLLIGNIEGRVDIIREQGFPTIVVDYAHTPDGFTKIFKFAQSICPKDGDIIAVFGAAGRRDTLKRPTLGSVANEFAHRIILTEEDQRDEKVSEINQAIRKGITDVPNVEVFNRYEAINQAIATALPHDIILILGKGREQFNNRGAHSSDYIGDYHAVLEIIDSIKEEENKDESEH